MIESSWQIIAGVIVGHLPDSIDERRKILSALVEVIPNQSGTGRAVSEMLFHLNRHSLAQREFSLGDELTLRPVRPARPKRTRSAP